MAVALRHTSVIEARLPTWPRQLGKLFVDDGAIPCRLKWKKKVARGARAQTLTIEIPAWAGGVIRLKKELFFDLDDHLRRVNEADYCGFLVGLQVHCLDTIECFLKLLEDAGKYTPTAGRRLDPCTVRGITGFSCTNFEAPHVARLLPEPWGEMNVGAF